MLFLYGIAGVLLAYCGALITSSPLAAFAAVAGYQVIIFVVCFFLNISKYGAHSARASTAIPCWLSAYFNLRENERCRQDYHYYPCGLVSFSFQALTNTMISDFAGSLSAPVTSMVNLPSHPQSIHTDHMHCIVEGGPCVDQHVLLALRRK